MRQLLVIAALIAGIIACGDKQTSGVPTEKPTEEPVSHGVSTEQPVTQPATPVVSTEKPTEPATPGASTEKPTEPAPTTPDVVTTERVTDAPLTTTQKDEATTAKVEETTAKDLPTTPVATESTTTIGQETTTQTTTQAPETEPPRTCAKNGDIKAIFILVDGTGSIEDHWGKVMPFIRMFKDEVSRHIPIWFYQWSSLPGKCIKSWNSRWEQRVMSWGCYGNRNDPCQGAEYSYAYCPDVQVDQIPTNWTDEDFDRVTQRVYNFYQNGWTYPWIYMKDAVEKWKVAKTEMGLGSDARALLIQMTDGQTTEINKDVLDTIQAFKEENMKFFGIYTKVSDANMAPYSSLIDDPRKDIVTVTDPATQLDRNLVKQIVTAGCETEEKPPRCSANGTMKAVYLMIDGSYMVPETTWPHVLPFVKLFKKYVDREVPVYLMQFSSSYECNHRLYGQCMKYCGGSGNRKSSWDCYDKIYDPCNNNEVIVNTTICPSKNLERVNPNWTDEEFDTIANDIYGIQQKGWNTPWWFFTGIGNSWKLDKSELGFAENDRALVVYVGDSYRLDSEFSAQGITAFKEAKQKFLGIQLTPTADALTHFNALMDNPGMDIILSPNDKTGLDEVLVKQIVRKGCN